LSQIAGKLCRFRFCFATHPARAFSICLRSLVSFAAFAFVLQTLKNNFEKLNEKLFTENLSKARIFWRCGCPEVRTQNAEIT